MLYALLQVATTLEIKIGVPPTCSLPACLPGVITVGSVDDKNRKAESSAYGDAVDLYAPGDNVWVADRKRGAFMQNSGTSFAAPYVFGVMADILTEELGGEDRAVRAKATLLERAIPGSMTPCAKHYRSFRPLHVNV